MRSFLLILACLASGLTPAAGAADLDFNQVLQKAIARSYDLNAAMMGTKIRGLRVEESKYLRYPELTLRHNTERVRDLSDGTATVTTIGNLTLPANTKYQNALSAQANYTLLDFGTTEKKIALLEKDVETGKIQEKRTRLDLETSIADLYGQALLVQREILVKTRLMGILEELKTVKVRLYGAGLLKKTDILDSEREIRKNGMELAEGKLRYKQFLADLSLYTGDSYDRDNTALSPLVEEEGYGEVDCRAHPVSRLADLEIEKKALEESLTTRNLFPKLGIYTQYDYYGADRDDLGAAYRDLRERTLSFGGYIAFPIMETARNYETLRRIRLEAAYLKLEREKKLAELKNALIKMETQRDFYRESLVRKKDLLEILTGKLALYRKLAESGAIDRMSFLTAEIDLIQESFGLEKDIVENAVALKKLKFLWEASR